MADPDFAEAIRVVAENVSMSTFDRRRVRLAIGDEDIQPGPAAPPPDPRDAEIAALKAQLAAQSPSPPVPASAEDTPVEAPSPEVAADVVVGAADAATSEEPVNPQVLPEGDGSPTAG